MQCAADFDRVVGETMQFFEDNLSLIERSEHEPAAFRTQVAS